MADALTTMARAVLEGLARGEDGDRPLRAAALLRPRPGDCALVFTGAVAPLVEPVVQALWDEGPYPTPNPGEDVIDVWMGRSGPERPVDGPLAELLDWLDEVLVPGRAWVAWRHHAPDARLGTRYDGLVWLDDHWAWIPRLRWVVRRAALMHLEAQAGGT